MLAYPKLDVSDTVLPGSTRRRIWKAPEVLSHSLVVLTLTRLHLAPPTGTPSDELVAVTEMTPDLNKFMGPLAVVVDLSTIRRVVLHLPSNTLRIEYVAGGMNAAQVSITLANPEAADSLFTKLWRRVGEKFALTPHAPTWWTTARTPVAVMAGILLGTAILALASNAASDFAGSSVSWMDWRAVCAMGGVALAIAQVRLYRRFTRPPAFLELVPS